MTNIYDHLPPPSGGDFPDWFKFNNPGDHIEGQITDQRIAQPKVPGDSPYPVVQVRTADGVEHSVAGGANSLYRQLMELRPATGGMIRITFTGFAGQAKLFQVDYQAPAPGTVVAPTQPEPFPAVAPAPQGFAPPGAPTQPWAQSIQAPAPAPWGPPPAAQ